MDEECVLLVSCCIGASSRGSRIVHHTRINIVKGKRAVKTLNFSCQRSFRRYVASASVSE